MPLSPLPASFYSRSVVAVARDLLGARLVRCLQNQRVGGYVIETEAYMGETDLACHARAGRTQRTEVMYGPAGHAYVYFIYGMHWMLNVVAEPEGLPCAVLIRAILPVEGIHLIAARRSPAPQPEWTSGPARLCKALDIDGKINGMNLSVPHSSLVFEPGITLPDADVICGPRVGIERVPEPWRSQPWRFRASPQALQSLSDG